MKTQSKVFTWLIFVLLITAVLVINAQKKPKEIQEPDVSQFPILDYAKKSTSKEKKNKKYNSRYAPKISESSDSVFRMIDWYEGLSALPINRSDAVIIGQVTKAQAELSDDETNIYSEFTVQIFEVLRNDHNFSLAVGNDVIVERLGGRVRLPSGKVVVSQTIRQDLPRIGKCYVLFLTKNNDGEDFHILTGYEIRDAKVFPLDKLSPTHPITAYTGTSESVFFTDLHRILTNPSNSRLR